MDPIIRCLENNYHGVEAPDLHVAFFDIETSFDQELGWSEASDALNSITSISVHLQWLDEIICLAVPPDTLTWEEASAIANEVGNVTLFRKESEMLNSFIDVIEDADVISGWNSEGYDIPYTVNRIKRILGKQETRRLCLWDQQPKERKFDRGGKESQTYDLIGRVHMDYMQLYKKYNFEERHSYALNAIAEVELGEHKVQYEGTLDELYNDDFKTFLEYNIQDTRLLDRLDKKLRFIDLANSIAHSSCVLIPTTMGAVALTDQNILMEAHSRGMICPDKAHNKEDLADRAAGGWVANPKKGVHKWIASTDMKSLYPSVLRALNMSPETIVGQIRTTRTDAEIAAWEAKGKKYSFAAWWNDRFNILEMDDFYSGDISTKLELEMESGEVYVVTGAELRQLMFSGEQPWCISANGTIFRTDVDGVIPSLLGRWYSERKSLQKIATEINEIISGVTIPDRWPDYILPRTKDIDLTLAKLRSFRRADLNHVFESTDIDTIVGFLDGWGLYVRDNKVYPKEAASTLWNETYKYWDKKQQISKISLNSAYGALLNAGSRFFDQRLGQSTTLTGRTITRHMAAKTNEMITGVYDYSGDAITYGDTDSTYFTAYPALKDEIERGEIEWTKDSIVELYNDIAKSVSATFPDFLLDTLNVPISKSKGVIASSRETISETGLFIVKKRYAVLMFDKDGIRLDVDGKPGKVKAMGLDLKRADTPKFVQKFLSEILLDTLTDKGENYVVDKIRIFKGKFEDMKPWEQGTPRAVNKLSHYREVLEDASIKKLKGIKVGNLHVPGHVTASLAWNRLRDLNNDQHSLKIIDGQKIIVCKLKQTVDNQMTSIALPVDEVHIPEWFMSLPFDSDEMMAGIVDQKIKNLLGVLPWDMSKTQKSHAHLATLFDFG